MLMAHSSATIFHLTNRPLAHPSNISNLGVFQKSHELIKFLIENGAKTKNKRLLADYASSGDFEMVKWLVDQGIKPYNHDAIKQAAAGGHNNIVEYLCKKTDLSEPDLLAFPVVNRYNAEREKEEKMWREFKC